MNYSFVKYFKRLDDIRWNLQWFKLYKKLCNTNRDNKILPTLYVKPKLNRCSLLKSRLLWLESRYFYVRVGPGHFYCPFNFYLAASV